MTWLHEWVPTGGPSITHIAFEGELQKIASTKLRAAEAAIGALLGGGVGFVAARDKDPDYSDEAAGALAGAVLGAGGAAGASAIVRALRARTMMLRQMPGAIEAGKAALTGPTDAAKAAKKAFEEAAEKAPKNPRELPPWLARRADLVRRVAGDKNRVAGAERAHDLARTDLRDATRAEASAVRQSYQQDLRTLQEQMDLLPANDQKNRSRVARQMRSLRESMDADLDEIHGGRVGPKAQGSPHVLAVDRARSLLQRKQDQAGRFQRMATALDRGDAQRHAVEAAQQAEAALKAAREALDAARATHGEAAVRKRVSDQAHGAFSEKLFGVIG